MVLLRSPPPPFLLFFGPRVAGRCGRRRGVPHPGGADGVSLLPPSLPFSMRAPSCAVPCLRAVPGWLWPVARGRRSSGAPGTSQSGRQGSRTSRPRGQGRRTSGPRRQGSRTSRPRRQGWWTRGQVTSHPKRPRAQLASADPRGFGVAVGDSPYPPAPTRTTTSPIPDNTPTINLLIPILPISGGHRAGAVTAPSGASSRRPGCWGGPSQPPRSSASLSGGRRPGEERLDTEERLSRASGMSPSPAPDSTAGAGNNPHPMAVSTPPRNSGKDGGVPGGPGEGPWKSGGADGVPSGGQVPPRLLLCPVPRRPPDLSRWEAPATPLELS